MKELRAELEKELLKQDWWLNLDKPGYVRVMRYGLEISVSREYLKKLAEKHNKNYKGITILAGG